MDLRAAMEKTAAESEEFAQNYALRAVMCLNRDKPDYGGGATYAQRASAAYLIAHNIRTTLEAWDAENSH